MTTDKVAILKLNHISVIPVIRKIAATSENVLFTKHAEKRMVERGITRTQVLRCLTKGQIKENPHPDMKGGLQFTMEVLSAGDLVTVVGALRTDEKGNQIIVITTYK